MWQTIIGSAATAAIIYGITDYFRLRGQHERDQQAILEERERNRIEALYKLAEQLQDEIIEKVALLSKANSNKSIPDGFNTSTAAMPEVRMIVRLYFRNELSDEFEKLHRAFRSWQNSANDITLGLYLDLEETADRGRAHILAKEEAFFEAAGEFQRALEPLCTP